MKNQKIVKRPIDILIDRYAEFHQKPVNQIINYICIPLISFSILGFVWSIPFPHLNFLGSYNGYLNWASFLIALVIYSYMKLSPIISYIMLLVLFAFAYAIIQLEVWQKVGGPILPQMCVVIFVMASIVQFIGYRIEGKKPNSAENFKFLAIEPLWLLSLILKKFKIKY